KSLVSILIREQIGPRDFLQEIDRDIKKLKSDPENISSRGESKGQLKKEVLNKIESLEKTKETVKFYDLYQAKKLELNILDYDDILANLVRLTIESEDVCNTLRERYQHILVDEHQDS